MTSNKYILQNGFSINLNHIEPSRQLFEYPKTCTASKILDTEIQKLLQKEVVIKTDIQTGDYFSKLFARKKKNGTYRTSLNLKSLYEECFTEYSKMESIKYAIPMTEQNKFYHV